MELGLRIMPAIAARITPLAAREVKPYSEYVRRNSFSDGR